MTIRSRITRFVPTSGDDHRVTTIELFFDLVFVFAITQVTALMADDPSPQSAAQGFVLMALLWWAWCSYTWLGNQAHADEGVVRAGIVLAMGALFLVALAIPETFGDLPGGMYAPAVFAVCYVAVRLIHLGVYVVAAGDDPGLRRQLARTAVPVVAAGLMLVVGSLADGAVQLSIWALALAVDYVGIRVVGVEGWRVRSATHFAERHGLIMIIAIGESIVAIGVGVTALPLSTPIVVAASLGVALSVCLWWLYFDVVAIAAEHALLRAEGTGRTRLAVDSYTYLHFPMVAGVIYIALGLKKVVEYVGDTEHHDLGDALATVPLVAMYAGVAAYLLAHVAFRRRNVGSWNPHRIGVALLVLTLLPLAAAMPALAALALLTAVLVALVAYEAVRFAEDRRQLRAAHS